jgi:signal transduction histidine kinase
MQRVVRLEQRLRVTFEPGAPVVLNADPDPLEQLLINLLRNAVDGVLEMTPSLQNLAVGAKSLPAVSAGWTVSHGTVEITIIDDGPGLATPANQFVPFFTTKPGGSGIGLVLSRQIAEAHGGSLALENRPERTGCVARLRLPVYIQS